MKNLEALTDELEKMRNPAAAIGKFLIASSNSPEFLAAHLREFADAAEADLAADREMATRLLGSVKKEMMRNPDGSRSIFDDVDE